jgi:hypothetical protein
MRWDDAQVVILELLCTPAQQWVLLDDVAAALRAIDDKRPIEPGRWSTFGVRLRKPRSPDEDAYLRESLAQPDDPLADEREAMVLEVGGRGSRRSAEEAAQVLCRALCPEEFHPGPCPIPWGEMNWGLRNASRDEKRFYRDLFPVGRARLAKDRPSTPRPSPFSLQGDGSERAPTAAADRPPLPDPQRPRPKPHARAPDRRSGATLRDYETVPAGRIHSVGWPVIPAMRSKSWS